MMLFIKILENKNKENAGRESNYLNTVTAMQFENILLAFLFPFIILWSSHAQYSSTILERVLASSQMPKSNDWSWWLRTANFDGKDVKRNSQRAWKRNKRKNKRETRKWNTIKSKQKKEGKNDWRR